ncbi:hypothetical protein DYB32_003295 [Aphanomyces invadans]|uniref:WW domain-containing protein n=1 Tax=Aphanomyces invadans TaxID=157072 RepID=A0A418B0X9_9STRA|nr:hypothetical protein DYB32_003295 [Aphanomyces invadans]
MMILLTSSVLHLAGALDEGTPANRRAKKSSWDVATAKLMSTAKKSLAAVSTGWEWLGYVSGFGEQCSFVNQPSSAVRKHLTTHLKAQDHAIHAIVAAIEAWEFSYARQHSTLSSCQALRRRTNAKDHAPLVLAITGPTGTGKTETSHLLAEALFKWTKRLDHSDKLGGLMMARIRLTEHLYRCSGKALVVFDEVQKRRVDTSNVIFVLISDIGVAKMEQLLIQYKHRRDVPVTKLENDVRRALDAQWARLQFGKMVRQVVPFLPFEPHHIVQVIQAKLDQLSRHYEGVYWKSLAFDSGLAAHLSTLESMLYMERRAVVHNVEVRKVFAKYGARNVESGPMQQLKAKLMRHARPWNPGPRRRVHRALPSARAHCITKHVATWVACFSSVPTHNTVGSYTYCNCQRRQLFGMAADWEAIVDESGVPYYYNPITGETAWSIPADDGAVDEWPPVAAGTDVEVATHSRPATASCGGGEWAFGGVNPDDGAFFFVHTATGERVANLPMLLAEAPTTPSTAHTHEDGAISVDVDPAVLVCMEDVVQAIETTLAVWMRRRQRNAKALAKQRQRGNVATTHGTTVDATREVHGRQPRAAVRMHHVLANAKRYECTAEYASRRAAMAAQVREDEVEKETIRVKERFAQRRQHQVKQAAAWRRANIKQDQIQLRHHITRVLIAKATNGLDIHGKIDLTSGDDRRPPGQPLQREELFESEERAAVARQRKRQLEHLFVAIDTDKRGTMSTLHVLHELAIQPHVVQPWVQPPRRGVQDMLQTGVLQAFFLQLQRVNVRQFVDFVEISEDVVARVDRIKAAMEQAGLGVVSADVATWQSSMLNVKSGESAANRQVVFVRRMQLAFQAAKVLWTSKHPSRALIELPTA